MMNTHDLGLLLLSVPAQDLRDMGPNERYAVRLDLKGLKIPGIASIGGWVYPETASVPAVATPPAVRRKALKSQTNPAPVAAVAPTAAKAAKATPKTATHAPAPAAPAAGKSVSLAELQTLLTGLGVTLGQ